ncbi:hypothetical protein MLD38_009432 [Melastoma candidum]|uniref:Uncharacterized protein n=1 Tax=Melastoma candidum TaxID=119954 RepID=A0ACB9RXI7_9MYRT|nr:hypothetical protein MLD38_009432 [Melastoma candidum]
MTLNNKVGTCGNLSRSEDGKGCAHIRTREGGGWGLSPIALTGLTRSFHNVLENKAESERYSPDQLNKDKFYYLRIDNEEVELPKDAAERGGEGSSAGVDVNADGHEEDGDEAEEYDGVDEDGEAAGAHAAELHHAMVPRDLEQQPRGQQHEQHHSYHHRPPVRHVWSRAS